MKSIQEIKEQFEQTDISELPRFIKTYSTDERSGVKKLLIAADKKISEHQKELQRTYEMFHFERLYSNKAHIAGIDEVGRGPLAGPVVTCAVILPKDCDILYLNDSKQLTAKKREELYEVLTEKCVYSLGIVDNITIDEINILQATLLAMRQAVEKLTVTPDQLLIDALTIPDLKIDQRGIIKGDTRSASIAAASIIAKVHRDRLMQHYDTLYPGYGFAKNMGYGTAEHIKALKELGPCPIHRKSFIGNFERQDQ